AFASIPRLVRLVFSNETASRRYRWKRPPTRSPQTVREEKVCARRRSFRLISLHRESHRPKRCVPSIWAPSWKPLQAIHHLLLRRGRHRLRIARVSSSSLCDPARSRKQDPQRSATPSAAPPKYVLNRASARSSLRPRSLVVVLRHYARRLTS